MSAKKRRENTFRIATSNVPKKPSSEEVHQFVGAILGLKRDNVTRIQYSRNLGVAFVKITCLEVAQKVVEENDNKHELTVDGKSFKTRLAMEDGAVEVKLFNLSEDVTNDKIARFLMSYGELFSIREEVWDEKHLFAGLPTGVRIVRMIVRKNIPSYVTIDCETTLVAYYGQQQSCRHCNESVHNGVSCIQNKKLLLQKLATSSNSYADVAKNSRPIRTKTVAPKPAVTKLATPNPTNQTNPVGQTPATSGSMPPPSVSIQRETGLGIGSSPVIRQQENENDIRTRVTRRTSKKPDGNETDFSTSSRTSQKHPAGKNMRCDEGSDHHDTDTQL